MDAVTDRDRVGVRLLGSGVVSIFMGILYSLDTEFIAFGYILIATGLAMALGVKQTASYFFRHVKATTFFFGGILVVLIGWPLMGL